MHKKSIEEILEVAPYYPKLRAQFGKKSKIATVLRKHNPKNGLWYAILIVDDYWLDVEPTIESVNHLLSMFQEKVFMTQHLYKFGSEYDVVDKLQISESERIINDNPILKTTVKY